jgi:hypothetical protein
MDEVTWIIELGVGIGCLAGGVAALRVPSLRIVGVIALAGGAAAVIHAIAALV